MEALTSYGNEFAVAKDNEEIANSKLDESGDATKQLDNELVAHVEDKFLSSDLKCLSTDSEEVARGIPTVESAQMLKPDLKTFDANDNTRNKDQAPPVALETDEPALREVSGHDDVQFQDEFDTNLFTSRLPTIVDMSNHTTSVESNAATRRMTDYSKTKFQPWSVEEDKLLAEGVALYKGKGAGGTIDWTCVAAHLGNIRSTKQCTSRWQTVCAKQKRQRLGPGAPRNADRYTRSIMAPLPTTILWTAAEDNRLVDALMAYKNMGLHGGADWNHIASIVGGGRTATACATRLQHITNGAYTHTKDQTMNGPKPLIVIPPVRPGQATCRLVLPPSSASAKMPNSATSDTVQKSSEKQKVNTPDAEDSSKIPSIHTLHSVPATSALLSSSPLLTSTTAPASEEPWEAVAVAIAPLKRPRLEATDSFDNPELECAVPPVSYDASISNADFKFASNAYSDMRPFAPNTEPSPVVPPTYTPTAFSPLGSEFPQSNSYNNSEPAYFAYPEPSIPQFSVYGDCNANSYSNYPPYAPSGYPPHGNVNIDNFLQWESKTLSRFANPYSQPMYPPYSPPGPPFNMQCSPRSYNAPFAYYSQYTPPADDYWSTEEDLQLVEYVQSYPSYCIDWSRIAAALGNRTAEKCYERYVDIAVSSDEHEISPRSRDSAFATNKWSHYEDELLMDAVSRFRSQHHSEIGWAAVCSFLSRHSVNRDAAECRARWTVLVSAPESNESLLLEAVALCRDGHSVDWNAVSRYMKNDWSPELCASYWYQTAAQRSSNEWAEFFRTHPQLESFDPLAIHDST